MIIYFADNILVHVDETHVLLDEILVTIVDILFLVDKTHVFLDEILIIMDDIGVDGGCTIEVCTSKPMFTNEEVEIEVSSAGIRVSSISIRISSDVGRILFYHYCRYPTSKFRRFRRA
jgi:hypothetical protein